MGLADHAGSRTIYNGYIAAAGDLGTIANRRSNRTVFYIDTAAVFYRQLAFYCIGVFPDSGRSNLHIAALQDGGVTADDSGISRVHGYIAGGIHGKITSHGILAAAGDFECTVAADGQITTYGGCCCAALDGHIVCIGDFYITQFCTLVDDVQAVVVQRDLDIAERIFYRQRECAAVKARGAALQHAAERSAAEPRRIAAGAIWLRVDISCKGHVGVDEEGNGAQLRFSFIVLCVHAAAGELRQMHGINGRSFRQHRCAQRQGECSCYSGSADASNELVQIHKTPPLGRKGKAYPPP